MVHAAYRQLLLVGAGLLLTGCASFDVRPAELPHHLYLGTYAVAIGTQPCDVEPTCALQDEERLVNEMAEGVGWWTAFRGAEHLIVEAAGRPLRWWERLLVFALPIAINVRRFTENLWGEPY